MDRRNVSFDWNQTRGFLVTAEEGSLSAAARALGLTQPTVGRQVAALEAELGVTLFERIGRSLALTKSGLELLDHVRAMGEAANRVSLAASGQSQTIEGQVCITATDVMSTYFLPGMLKQLRELAPAVEVEIVASNANSDLKRREADIAIRHAPSQDSDLIAELVRETSANFYATAQYLERYGRPTSIKDLSGAVFIGFEQSDLFLQHLTGLGLSVTKDNFKLAANSGVVSWELVKQGLGIGVMIEELAAITPEVERLFPELGPLPIPVWLTTHRELHTSRRIRLVYDFLADALSQDDIVLGGPPRST